MAELARGTVLDRPWGWTLAALGMRGLTGQLTVTDGKPYQVAFVDGAVVAAHSPLGSDAAVRVAMTLGLVSSSQVADIVRRQAAAPGRDEIDVLAEAVRLGGDQGRRLRRRVIAQRAARTFGVDKGQFVVDDQITLPVVPGSELDIRTVVYLGVRQFLSELRLNTELGQMGTWFQLRPEAEEDLPQFGFGEAEYAIVDMLRGGATLTQIERPELDQRIVRAAVYALVSCNACQAEAHAPAASSRRPAPRAATPPAGTPTTPAPTTAAASARQATSPQAAPRPRTPSGQGRVHAPIPTNRKRDDAQTAEVVALIESRLALLDQRADHFALLGVDTSSTTAAIRTAYFALAKQLHPDRLASLGIADDERRAQRLFAEVNTAFAVLTDPVRRKEYQALLQRGGEGAVRAEQARAEEMAQRVIESEEAYRRGEAALRSNHIAAAVRELERAIELNPDEADFHAALAWARFCGAPDKVAAAPAAKQALDRAIRRAPRAATARFYLARVERMIGHDHEALRLFREVLELEPHNAEASSEVRVIEARLADKDSGGGLFGRLKR